MSDNISINILSARCNSPRCFSHVYCILFFFFFFRCGLSSSLSSRSILFSLVDRSYDPSPPPFLLPPSHTHAYTHTYTCLNRLSLRCFFTPPAPLTRLVDCWKKWCCIATFSRIFVAPRSPSLSQGSPAYCISSFDDHHIIFKNKSISHFSRDDKSNTLINRERMREEGEREREGSSIVSTFRMGVYLSRSHSRRRNWTH